jgi:hypothetical protein
MTKRRRIRVHLRTNNGSWRIGIRRLTLAWGYNIGLGWWFIAIRENDGVGVHRGFWDLGFGRAQNRLWRRVRRAKALRRRLASRGIDRVMYDRLTGAGVHRNGS